MLYKYLFPQSLSVESILHRLEVYYSLSSELNDPFELKPNIICPSKTALKKYLKSRGALHRDLKQLVPLNMELYKKNINHFRKEIMRASEGIGFFCLTPHPNSLLMWSHYADSHRGICVGFEIDQADDFDSIDPVFGLASPIEYSDHYPQLSMLDIFHWREIGGNVIQTEDYDLVENIFKKIMFTKGRIWKYENEVRCFNLNSNTASGLVKFPSRKLKEVIIGASASQETKDKVIKYTKSNFPHAFLKQAVVADKMYELAFTSIK